MLSILLTIIVIFIIYIFLKPWIDKILYSVPNEPVYIHSYLPFIGFAMQMGEDPAGFLRSFYLKYGKIFAINVGSKRWVYFYDEQAYLKVLKSPDLSMDEFINDFSISGMGINRRCLINEDIQQITQDQLHKYLVGAEAEILNKRVHDSLLQSMKHDAKLLHDNPNRVVNFFDLFGEFMLYASCDGLFGHAFTNEQRNATPNFYRLFQHFHQAFKLGILRVPLRTIRYKSIFEDRLKFVKRFYSLNLNNDESSLIRAREELYRSDAYKHLFTEHDIAALQAALLWVSVTNTGPMSCWSIVDLLLHPDALKAVKQELEENVPPLSTEFIYDTKILSNLKILESCIYESMRRVANSSSRRQVMKNTTIECSDKTIVGLRKGDVLIYPASLKHHDPDVFGPDPYRYQYDRFVKKTDQLPSVNFSSTMLFGCGTYRCPGRSWAINKIKMLVALIIQHMDIEFINMTEQDKDDYRDRLPYNYSKFASTRGPMKDCEHKFNIRYSYKNMDVK